MYEPAKKRRGHRPSNGRCAVAVSTGTAVSGAWIRACRSSSCRHRLAATAGTVAALESVVCTAEWHAIVCANASRITARGEAEDMRCSRTDIANVLLRKSIELIDVDPFALQQIPFHGAAERIVSCAARGGNNSMTRNEKRHS